MPLVVRTRAVALLVGDCGEHGVDRASVQQVVAFAGVIGKAFERIIVRRKLDGFIAGSKGAGAGSHRSVERAPEADLGRAARHRAAAPREHRVGAPHPRAAHPPRGAARFVASPVAHARRVPRCSRSPSRRRVPRRPPRRRTPPRLRPRFRSSPPTDRRRDEEAQALFDELGWETGDGGHPAAAAVRGHRRASAPAAAALRRAAERALGHRRHRGRAGGDRRSPRER